MPSSPSVRLSISSLSSVPDGDIAVAPVLYCLPCGGDEIPVHDGSEFALRSVGNGIALDLDGASGHAGFHEAGKVFDCFAYFDGSLRLGTAPAWTSSFVRASALTLMRGLPVNQEAITLRYGTGAGDCASVSAGCATYLGSISPTAHGQARDTATDRLLYNAYNRTERALRAFAPSGSYYYSTDAWRQAIGAYSVCVLLGLSGTKVRLGYAAGVKNSTATPRFAQVSIGINSADTPATQATVGKVAAVASVQQVSAALEGNPGIGLHRFVPLERGGGVDSQEWYVTGGSGWRDGLVGSVLI